MCDEFSQICIAALTTKGALWHAGAWAPADQAAFSFERRFLKAGSHCFELYVNSPESSTPAAQLKLALQSRHSVKLSHFLPLGPACNLTSAVTRQSV